MATIYTIGHSTRTFEELVTALDGHAIATLVDIRAFPASRRLPHFNRESLEAELPKRGIGYRWMKELGGRRKKIRDDSPNTGLRNEAFRNYADYMLTPEFVQAVARLVELANPTASPSTLASNRALPALGATQQEVDSAGRAFAQDGSPQNNNVAIMCAERVYFQCHRMLVSDYLTAHGHEVLHIEDEKLPARLHKLMTEAHLVDGHLLYNAQELF